ncbi:hypothetical protein JCM14469_25710 [Desulfatiferula olefinivorans]
MTARDEDRERRKQAIFDGMGKRGQKRILQQGYEAWDPFEEPKDPLDIRKDVSKRTVNQLVHEFLQTRREETSSVAFAEGVMEMALALMNNNDKYRGMFAYALWYADLLKREGHDGTL